MNSWHPAIHLSKLELIVYLNDFNRHMHGEPVPFYNAHVVIDSMIIARLSVYVTALQGKLSCLKYSSHVHPAMW